LGFEDKDSSTMQSFKGEDAHILHGVDKSEGHLPELLQQKGEQTCLLQS